MTKRVSLEQFPKQAAALLKEVVGKGEAVVVEDADRPVAVLASHASVMSMAAIVDLPRWEEWLNEMRYAFPEAAGKLARLSTTRSGPEPTQIDKADLGFQPSAGIVGSASGREFLTGELRRLGVPVVDESLLDVIYARLLHLCEDKDRIYDADLRVLAQELIAEAPQRLRLLTVTVQSTTGLPATAEVMLEMGQGPAMRREHGDGPLDAAINAIERLTGLSPEVENFSVVAATKGRDAMAEAMIELTLDGVKVVGAGASTNAIEAGIHAYLNALNFLLEARPAPPQPSPGAKT